MSGDLCSLLDLHLYNSWSSFTRHRARLLGWSSFKSSGCECIGYKNTIVIKKVI